MPKTPTKELVKSIDDLLINGIYDIDDLSDVFLMEIDDEDQGGNLLFSFVRATANTNLYFVCNESHIKEMILAGKLVRK